MEGCRAGLDVSIAPSRRLERGAVGKDTMLFLQLGIECYHGIRAIMIIRVHVV